MSYIYYSSHGLTWFARSAEWLATSLLPILSNHGIFPPSTLRFQPFTEEHFISPDDKENLNISLLSESSEYDLPPCEQV